VSDAAHQPDDQDALKPFQADIRGETPALPEFPDTAKLRRDSTTLHSSRSGGQAGKDLWKLGAAGTEFVATTAAGLLIGYGLDWAAGTTPWLLLVFFAIGLGLAFRRLVRSASAM